VVLEHQEDDVFDRVFGPLMGIHGRTSSDLHGTGITVRWTAPDGSLGVGGEILQAGMHSLQEGNRGTVIDPVA
jgi:hypothetical protein